MSTRKGIEQGQLNLVNKFMYDTVQGYEIIDFYRGNDMECAYIIYKAKNTERKGNKGPTKKLCIAKVGVAMIPGMLEQDSSDQPITQVADVSAAAKKLCFGQRIMREDLLYLLSRRDFYIERDKKLADLPLTIASVIQLRDDPNSKAIMQIHTSVVDLENDTLASILERHEACAKRDILGSEE